MASLLPIARRFRRDHALAKALWETGIHEARILAVLVDDPAQVTPRQMDDWAAAFDSWDLCDQACMKLFVHTDFVGEKIPAWAEDEREFVRRAGFALLAARAVHAKNAADADFAALLPLIERHAGDPRNFVKKAVNWSLRQIGKRSVGLNRQALGLAIRLADSLDKTRRWVGRDAVRELSDPKQLARLKER